MSTSTASGTLAHSVGLQRASDYLVVMKPKIVVMELLTVAVSAVVTSSGLPDLWMLAHVMFGGALVFAGASAWNQWLERDSDALMARTADRPLPSARLSAWEVGVFGSVSALIGVTYLGLRVNLPTAALGTLTWLIYVAIYTPLKSRSTANTTVGAVAGALPILMGWTAVEGHRNLVAATLFLIVFLWQYPHFMAIAWICRRQYAAAGLKMSPVVDPSGRRAGVQAAVTALALVPVSLVPVMVGSAGPLYLIFALALGLGQLYCAWAFLWRTNDQTARTLMFASLIYLPVLLLSLITGSFPH